MRGSDRRWNAYSIYGFGASAHLTAQIARAGGARVHVMTRSESARALALAALDRGGTLAIAGIHMSDIPTLNYEQHLFQERTVTSTTANTRRDGAELLAVAARRGAPNRRAIRDGQTREWRATATRRPTSSRAITMRAKP